MKKKILIANRGEIALRIIRAVQELDYTAVAIYETPDKDALHIRVADEAIWIGDGPRSDYLSIEKVINAVNMYVTPGIIDMHVHVSGIGSGGSGNYLSAAIRNNFRFKIYLKAFGVSRQELEDQGDQIIVAKIAQQIYRSKHLDGAVILALDGVMDDDGELDLSRTEVYIPNEFVLKETSKYPSLYYGASINPYRKDAIQRLERAKKNGAKLIKWLPPIQFIDPADPKIIPFYKKLIQLDLPLLVHVGEERSFTSSRDELCDPKRLELPLSLGVTVIAAHVGTKGESEGVDNVDRILPLFTKYPNLYGDISSLTQVNKLGYLRQFIKDKRLEGRLLYGTDYPLINTILTSPLYFPFDLSLKEISAIRAIDNSWDRDVILKQSLGVATEVFHLPGRLLNIDQN